MVQTLKEERNSTRDLLMRSMVSLTIWKLGVVQIDPQ